MEVVTPNFNKYIHLKYIENIVTLVCTKLHKLKLTIAKAPYRGRGDTPLPHPPAPLPGIAFSFLICDIQNMEPE